MVVQDQGYGCTVLWVLGGLLYNMFVYFSSNVIKDFVFEDKDKDLEPRTRTWNRGQGLKKLKAKIKDIQMPLLQRHITVNWGDFNRILNILNVIRNIVLLE